MTFTLSVNNFSGGTQRVTVNGHRSTSITWPTSHGYYDVVLTADTGTGWTQRYAGRIATTG